MRFITTKFTNILRRVVITGLICSAPALAASGSVLHDLDVVLDPQSGGITATDRIKLPQPERGVEFSLHPDLTPTLVGDGALTQVGAAAYPTRYRVERGAPSDQLQLSYHGRIRHALQQVTEGMGRNRQQTPGIISTDGAFLSGATGWYPRISGATERFSLQVDVPDGWLAISQGAGPSITHADARTRVRWTQTHPQDEIYLVAGPYTLYQRDAGGILAQAFLRSPDQVLADRYLAATADYLRRYCELIGPYSYAKFALVENFWESGYGMPSFTLLGSRVLRLPFILYSAYPHEILHNWWGNGVFIDWRRGNWSEGLTAYLADHLNKALAGQGSAYRYDQLKAYADYVSTGEDRPLSEFRARHGESSQAIGYGKSLMVFHMLRALLGDAAFIRGLRRFYVDNQFQAANWDQLRLAFEQASGTDLELFLSAWLRRPGAARLELDHIDLKQTPRGRYRITGRIRQSQPQPPFPMQVPIVVHDDQGQPAQTRVAFSGAPDEREQPFEIELDQPPLRLAVDPQFDTFRVLEPGETPPSLSSLFGSPVGTFVLPAQAPPTLDQAYRTLVNQWRQGHPGWQVMTDAEIKALPDGPVWLLGWTNRFLAEFASQSPDFRLDVSHHGVTLMGRAYADRIPVLTRETASGVLGWLATSDATALPGLTRKLPHYGKYGYLLFSGTAPDIKEKGQWSVRDSPLIHWFEHSARPVLISPPRPTLLDSNRLLEPADDQSLSLSALRPGLTLR